MNPEHMLSRLKGAFDRHLAKNITFRSMARCDAFPLFVASQNENYNRFLLWVAPPNERDILPRVDKLLRDETLGKILALSICDKKTGTWRGSLTFRPFRDGIEMGLSLHPDVWNRGVVFTAGQAAIEVVLEQLPDVPFYIRVQPGNVRMERICHRFAFLYQERMTETHPVSGSVDLDVYLLDKPRWERYPYLESY